MLVAKEGLFTDVHPLALLGVVLRTLRCRCFRHPVVCRRLPSEPPLCRGFKSQDINIKKTALKDGFLMLVAKEGFEPPTRGL